MVHVISSKALLTLLFLATDDRQLLMNPSEAAPRGRSASPGFYFIHSRHEQDFLKREAMNRASRNLEPACPLARSVGQDTCGARPTS